MPCDSKSSRRDQVEEFQPRNKLCELQLQFNDSDNDDLLLINPLAFKTFSLNFERNLAKAESYVLPLSLNA
jgi:hypothetical protein